MGTPVGVTTHVTREEGSRAKVWRPPQKLRAPVLADGTKTRWVRREVRGEKDDKNVISRQNEGYEFVRPDEVKDGTTYQSLDDGKHGGLITTGDLVLMKTDNEIVKQRTAYYEGRSGLMEQAVEREFDKNQNDLLPTSKQIKSTATRGRNDFGE